MESNNNISGIISIVCVGIVWFVYGLFFSIVAIIAGAIGFKTTIGKIGLVIGIIEFILMITWLGSL